MNASMVFLLAFVAVFGGVSSVRRLNTISFGDGIFDQSTDQSETGQSNAIEFTGYGTTFTEIFNDFESSSNTTGVDFSTGNIIFQVTANNTDDEQVIGQGFSIINTTSTTEESSFDLNSGLTSSSDGPGSSDIDFQFEGEAQLGGNSQSGVQLAGSDSQQSETNATSNIVASGSGIAEDGFSFSTGTICAGSGCP